MKSQKFSEPETHAFKLLDLKMREALKCDKRNKIEGGICPNCGTNHTFTQEKIMELIKDIDKVCFP